MREKVEGAIDDIKMAKYLATIRTDVPIALNLEEMRVTPPNEQKLRALFDELEFKRMTERFLNKPEIKQKTANTQLDLFAANPTNGADEPKKSLYSSLKTTSHKYQLIDNKQEAVELYDFLRTKKNLSLDTETTSTNAIEAELVGLSFAVTENEAYYVAIPANRQEALEYVDIFKPIYEDPEILKIGQNIKYDYMVLRNYGVDLQGRMFDTMLAHYVIQPELQHNMDYLAETLLNYQTVHIE